MLHGCWTAACANTSVLIFSCLFIELIVVSVILPRILLQLEGDVCNATTNTRREGQETPEGKTFVDSGTGKMGRD